tara:strand:+ start:284 stop:880 length:597 start_codon:yes stop_codon:yes gene_type:complete
MALIVGIKNGPDKGFTDEELEFTNGFMLGSASYLTGCGDCRDPREFLNRLTLVWPIFAVNEENEPMSLPDFVNLEFVERMKEAGWNTNAAGWTSQLQFAVSLSWFLIRDHKSKYGGPSMERKNYEPDEIATNKELKFLDSTWSPEEHLRGHGRKQRQFEDAIYAISNDRFFAINKHKTGEIITIDPKEYDSEGYWIEQ